MDAREVILRPVITEASVYAMDDKKYTFLVHPKANKAQVKHAIEEIFDVDVEKVNIMNTPRKAKRFGRYQGFTASRKKAIVTLTEASADIEIFGDESAEE